MGIRLKERNAKRVEVNERRDEREEGLSMREREISLRHECEENRRYSVREDGYVKE